ncbi:glycosyl hydrolase family 18 protein [Pedobacter xixiisoli]|uniref:chitinase n=1 Tax=Pedobacter xixiisoli TaxID=1476464 RepID=A0A286ADK6_9SPHI|nr:glycosyl hydrolase family 18 protein [Pedobacter xixiisoli]SOD19978.1 Chitinase, GH18 family [Pedobacter xixiisoli]
MKKHLLYLATVLIFLASCSKKDDPAPMPVDSYVSDKSFKVVAYMPGYRDPALIPDAKYKMITHLFFAFLNINPTADGSVVSLTATEQSRFNVLKSKAAQNNVKFGISVMGAESIFATVAGNSATRAKFVADLVSFVKANDLAGLDMDWEYPRTTSTTDVNPNANYTLLMKELSAELHKANKFLSAAITPGVYASSNRHAIAPEVYQYVDFFNIMQYDGSGYDTSEPLNHASYKMTEASLNFWLGTKGMPKEKAILGMPIYGKSATGSSITYAAIIAASKANADVNVATVSGVAYGYNGMPTIKQKAQLAKDKCNGIMFWEFGQDTNDETSLIKAANDQLGRTY